ncbi:MAG: efflux RND transporter periplasmic adaptor subunit [Chloroflexota bacterium]|nr:efflux RND transporter periplasmic adaptor subunit [Chloroflexota bacterium]
MRRRAIYVTLALVVAAAAGVLLWHFRPSGGGDEDVLQSAAVDRGSMAVIVTASGRIEPEARVDLTFDTPGRVAEVFVQEGDQVVRGDPLARLEDDQLALQVGQAEAALASAEAQLAQLVASPRTKEIEQAEASLRAASAQLHAAEANRDQVAAGPTQAEIASARAQVVQARTGREVAQDAYDGIDEEGTKKGQANYDLYTAKQELAAAEAQLENLLAGADEDELRAAQANVATTAAQRDASQAQLSQLLAGPTDEEIAEAEAQVDQAEVALALANFSLRSATLRAPFSGIVSQVNMTPGEVSPTRQPPIVLLDRSGFHMTISVDELDISRLKEGQSAEMTLEALPEAIVTGTVRTIAPIAGTESGVVTYDVVIDLAATDAALRPDMTASATIVIEELADVLRIPAWAVRVDRETGQTFVYRRVGEQIERVDVEIGARYEGIAQVLSGLSEGDELVRLDDSNTFGFGPR